MINDLNDIRICEQMAKARRNFDLVNHLMAEGGNHALFLTCKNVRDAMDEVMNRLNEIHREKGKP